jgi:hypothetical protein
MLPFCTRTKLGDFFSCSVNHSVAILQSVIVTKVFTVHMEIGGAMKIDQMHSIGLCDEEAAAAIYYIFVNIQGWLNQLTQIGEFAYLIILGEYKM